jgi:hypothetical protein
VYRGIHRRRVHFSTGFSIDSNRNVPSRGKASAPVIPKGKTGTCAIAAPAAKSMDRNASPPTPSPAARLLIVDDHELVRASLRFLLTSEPGIKIVGEPVMGVKLSHTVAGFTRISCS